MDPDLVPSGQRRTFLMVMAGALGAVLAAASVWPLLRFLAPVDSGGSSKTVRIDRSQVPVGTAHFFQYQGRPAVVLQPTAGRFMGLSAVCTHLGCVVSWESAQREFLCPCHGGRFSAEGQVLGGPPPKPLEPIAVALEGDQIVVG